VFFLFGAFLFVARVAIIHWNLEDVIKSGNRPYADLVKSGYNNTKNAQSFNDPSLCLAIQ
jgi:hypothetical protein